MRAAVLALALCGALALVAAQGELPAPAAAVEDDPFAYPEMIIRAEGALRPAAAGRRRRAASRARARCSSQARPPAGAAP